ncbi:Solute carrier family 2, facilitated glucose transporter member 5 [Collichthys lucidus]|uniref:Solute carrier family 2, facilitated glucose transporter member 5 n=1 Tax=Collichthys lucidus TaxID=240159 RepID=A0A4V6AN21_COLLU|nr:Solute carrier family 2, facilitated glucose transporter member 5 [Collichthys lucidus]
MIWSLIVSMYAVGGLFGTMSVTFVSGMLGRKKAMICNSSIAIVAAGIMMTSKYARSYEMIIVARILYGYTAGLGLSTHLMYLGEISPRKFRGIVTLTSVTFGSLGKLSGQFFGLSEILGREELWNIVLCVPAFFSVVQVIVLPFLPEAPRYLFIEKGDDMACKKALQSLWGQGDYKEEMDEMLAEQLAIEAAPPKSPLQLLRDRSVRWQLMSMSIIYCCNQLSGMSAISIFSFDIFLKAGIPGDKIRYVTLGLGVSEIITSISCVSNSLSFTAGGATATLNSELFIQSNRLASFVLMGIQRWLMFAIMGLVFPFLITALNSYCFVLFACMCLLGFLFTFFILPETKGKTLLEISEEFKALTVCGKSSLEKKNIQTKL